MCPDNTLENLLKKSIENLINCKIRNSKGLYFFAKERAKFEGWFKVEICNVLAELGKKIAIIPEKGYNKNKNYRIDLEIKYGECIGLIELKTINTNYKYEGVTEKTKPITDNVDDVIKDINRLKEIIDPNTENISGYVIFIVFPLEEENINWEKHLNKIKELAEIKLEQKFEFHNKIPGIVYVCKIKP